MLHLAFRTETGAQAGEEAVRITPLAAGRREVRLGAGPAASPSATLILDETEMTLSFHVQPGLLHYFRLADATLVPLPPAYPPAQHAVLPWQARWHGPTLHLLAGDCYVLLSPGALAIADSPQVARFVHLRDYFNAEKLAQTLLAHLVETAPAPPAQPVTVLVVEAR